MFYNGSQFDDGAERVFVWVINTGLQIRTNVSSVGKRTNLKSDNATGVLHVFRKSSQAPKGGGGLCMCVCVCVGGGGGGGGGEGMEEVVKV